MSFVRVLVVVTLLSPSARALDYDWPPPPRSDDAGVERADDTERERVSLSLTSRSGLVEAPFVTAAFPEVSGFGTVLTGVAAVEVPPVGWFSLRMPVCLVRLDFPAGAQVSETALGNLELGVEHGLSLRRETRLRWLAAFVVPTASSGPGVSLLENRALAIGNALNGGKDSELLTPGVMGLRVGASLEHSWRRFESRASIEVPILVRVSDASLPDETELHAVGIVPTLELDGAYWATSWFGVGLGAVLVTEPLRVQEPALESDRNQRAQFVAEPGLYARIGDHVGLALDASIPVGGALGGGTWSIGLLGSVRF